MAENVADEIRELERQRSINDTELTDFHQHLSELQVEVADYKFRIQKALAARSKINMCIDNLRASVRMNARNRSQEP